MRSLSIIGIPLFKGQRFVGVKDAPKYFRYNNFKSKINKNVTFSDIKVEEKDLSKSLIKIKDIISDNHKNDFNLFIGGDHSMSMATISSKISDVKDNYAIVWIDAHTDCNTFETSPTNNVHGMSVSGLTGLLPGPYQKFKSISSKNIIYIGIRSIDKGENEILKKNESKVISMDDINNDFENKLEEINNFIKNKRIYITFDVDALDPSLVSSTGTPVENGLNLHQANKIFDVLSNHNIISMDLVEFNPLIGNSESSYKNISNILINFINKIN